MPFFLRGNGDNRLDRQIYVFFTFMNLIHIAIFYFNAFYLYPKFLNKRRWPLYILAVFAVVFLSFRLKHGVISIWFPELLHNFKILRFVFAPTVFFLILSTVYRLIADKISAEKAENERKAEQLAAELKFLRSQVNPHFIFNVLTNLISLARKKSDKLEPALIMLSELMRYTLDESQGKKLPLKTEAAYLTNYIALQKMRFDEVEIKTEIAIPNEYQDYEIEPMLLIPFVENAFKHGKVVGSDPFIHLRLGVDDKLLTFILDNKKEENGMAKDQASGIGLHNVKTRLALLYPGKHQLVITDAEQLFEVALTIKLE
jgi:two-component system, LytTR family, sensor kinase